MTDLTPSLRSTYDSAETGPRYHVTTAINDKTTGFRKPIPDPFARTTVYVGLRDIIRALFLDRRLVVEVTVGADRELMDDVLELDEQALVPGRTRQAAFRQSMHSKLAAFGAEAGQR